MNNGEIIVSLDLDVDNSFPTGNYCEKDIFKKYVYKLTPGANHYNTIYAHN